jgi:tetratricopeptide (TPR) repeat protein
MNLADERLKELDNPSLATDERALLRCRLATELIQEGQYEVACQALGDFWRGVGERPDLEGLRENVAAEVLLRVGVLTGWIGACRQIQGAQESAKDLISESATFFEALDLPERAAVARCKLAPCYLREGAYNEAHALLTNALEWLTEEAERAEAIVKLAIVECAAGRYSDALTFLKEHVHLFDERVNHSLRASFHNQLALVLKQLGILEGRSDYFDRASSNILPRFTTSGKQAMIVTAQLVKTTLPTYCVRWVVTDRRMNISTTLARSSGDSKMLAYLRR